MKIQAPNKQKNFVAPFFLALLILVVLGAGLLALLYSQTPQTVSSFEIQSYAGKTEISLDGKTWVTPNRGEAIGVGNWIATNENGEVDLLFGKNTFLRVKENSRLQIQTPQVFSKGTGRIHLEKGTILVSSQDDNLQVSVPGRATAQNSGFLYDFFAKFVVSAQNATFLASASADTGTYQVSVLQGELQIHPGIPYNSKTVKSLEMIQGNELAKSALSEKEWGKVREAYEITPKSAAQEASQMDISRKAGNLFNHVFDHGTFYQEKWGFATRQFVEPEEAGAPVYMQTDYDVFPKASWVGVYFKTRDLDLSKIKSFSLDARRVPGKSYPDFIRVEFKTKYMVIRTLAIKMLREDWQTFSFPITFSKETPITEITVIFTNEKVGPSKVGAVQFKNFTVEAAPEKPAVPVVAAPVVKAVPPAAPAPKAVEAPKTPAAAEEKPAVPPAKVGDAMEFK